jgi:hypothetical protein
MLQLSLQRYNVMLYKRIACDAKLFLALNIFTATYAAKITRETEQYELRNGRTGAGGSCEGCMTCFAALFSV